MIIIELEKNQEGRIVGIRAFRDFDNKIYEYFRNNYQGPTLKFAFVFSEVEEIANERPTSKREIAAINFVQETAKALGIYHHGI